MNNETIKIWKRKLIELEEKVREFNKHRLILINTFNELNTRKNIKLNNLLYSTELQEEISHLNDWIEFNKEKISRLKNKIDVAKKEVSEQEFKKIKQEVKLKELIEEKEPEVKEKPIIEIKEEKKIIKPKKKVILEKTPTKELFKFISKEVKPEKEEISKEIKELLEEEEKPLIKVKKEKIKLKEKIPLQELFKFVSKKIEKEEKPVIKIKKIIKPIEKIPTKELFKFISKEIKKEPELKVKEIIKKPILVEVKRLLKKKKPKIGVKRELKKQVKELFVGKKEIIKPIKLKEKLKSIKIPEIPTKNIFEYITKLDKNKLIRYAVPVIMLLLVTSLLFISKPQITSYVTLTQEKTYDDDLSLIINESGNYTWTLDKTGIIKAIKATGRVKGNGTVKIYIEKDGERYLIFDNEK